MSFSQNVFELILGVNIPDLNLWIQINSVKQPIKCNSVVSGNMCQFRTSAFHYHLDYRFIVLRNIKISFIDGNTSREKEQNQHAMAQEKYLCWLHCFFSDALIRDGIFRWGLSFCFRFEPACNTSIIESTRSSAGIPSSRNLASSKQISASTDLCDTHVCFLHIQLVGRNVSSEYAQGST